jgi:hypothetical protein
MSKDKAYDRWLKAQKAAVANFKPVTNCPDCFGSLPQSNESAWAKGCKECPLYTDSNACAKATRKVNDAALTKKEWESKAKRYKELMSAAAWDEQFGNGQPTF